MLEESLRYRVGLGSPFALVSFVFGAMLFSQICLGQDRKVVSVESWAAMQKREIVEPFDLTYPLDVDSSDISHGFTSRSGTSYTLRIVRNRATQYMAENWQVMLVEGPDQTSLEGIRCGNLLRKTPLCADNDFFPSEDQVAIFSPSFNYEGIPERKLVVLKQKVSKYPTETERRILVHGFYVILKGVLGPPRDNSSPKNRRFDLTVSVRNHCGGFEVRCADAMPTDRNS